ncbi:uncharacterized protein LOC113795471 [Dermatophagoides pteronyssinus]|uniref:uncharacterized protein LOC113795471 n=1 Tax=Dermatophagoides pteronyssinus TaxID=6956 RepID=UPI003F67902E
MTTLESENSSKIYFTEQTKMSLNLIELRLDNHLKRIMKEYRLSNLSNAIKKLSLETRICEKLLEIMNSCHDFIYRKMPAIKAAKNTVTQLRQDHVSQGIISKEMLKQIKQISVTTEQIIWALNSNKEHLSYIARVYTIPEQYCHNAIDDDDDKAHDNDNDIGGNENNLNSPNSINMRKQLITVIEQCQLVIDICRLIRLAITSLIKNMLAKDCLPIINNNNDNHQSLKSLMAAMNQPSTTTQVFPVQLN